jgi:hypothetical protein
MHARVSVRSRVFFVRVFLLFMDKILFLWATDGSENWPKFVPSILNRPFKFHSCNCQPWFRVVSQKQRRSNHANLRENRCDIRCCWRDSGQQHDTSRSLVPSSLLPSSPLRLPSSLLPSSLLRLLSSASPPSSLRLVSLLKEGTLRPPQRAAFSLIELATWY